MKKFLFLTSIIFSLLIINSCNSKEETAPNNVVPIPESPVVETKQADPQQNWKESFLSDKTIETEKDIESIKLIIEKAVENNTLDKLQTFLETESKKEKAPPQILFGLSLVYGRKGLIKEEYKAIEKLEEQVKQRPGIAFNLSLVYGRKATLKSQIDKAEVEAKALLQGYISVISTPEGADVYMDGVLKGTTPFTTKGLEEGSYEVELRLKDYTDISKTTSVKAGKTTEVAEEFVLMPGSLTINSEPVGSTVLLDGEKIGVSPLEISKIEMGEYELTISKDTFKDEKINVTVEPGKNTSININLEVLTGILSFNNLTDGAEVYLDNKRVYPETGTTLQRNILQNITVGKYELSIQKKNYKQENLFITISPNQYTFVNGELEIDIFEVPFAEIKIDGKLDDWNNIEPARIDPKGDSSVSISGTDITKVFLAKNKTYLFLRMDLADGKPSKLENMIYEIIVWADTIPSAGQYFLEIRIQSVPSNQLKPLVYILKKLNNKDKDTMISFNDKGFLKIGENFFEAKYPISAFKKYLVDDISYRTEIRSWQAEPVDKMYDIANPVQISFNFD